MNKIYHKIAVKFDKLISLHLYYGYMLQFFDKQ